jgi:general secretion pathway protein A
MYDRFFGLSKSPFSMTPDPELLLLTEAHREALAGLTYAVTGCKGFVVLEGEAGTGKTTLLRRLLQVLPETDAQTSVVLNPVLTPAEFLELLLINFRVKDLPVSKAQRLARLEQMLIETNREGRVAVLIIDEAHKLSHEVLEEIRLLTNFETHQSKLLQIVLTGQPELKDILNRPDLWQLKQRVAVRLKIKPLSPNQITEYLVYRWTRAGGSVPLPFTEDGISAIARWSRGIPRIINSICDNALLLAFSDGIRRIGSAMIDDVVADLDLATQRLDAAPTPVGASSNGSHATPAALRPTMVETAPLRLGTLDRYMPRPGKARFPGLRWINRRLTSTEGI